MDDLTKWLYQFVSERHMGWNPPAALDGVAFDNPPALRATPFQKGA